MALFPPVLLPEVPERLDDPNWVNPDGMYEEELALHNLEKQQRQWLESVATQHKKTLVIGQTEQHRVQQEEEEEEEADDDDEDGIEEEEEEDYDSDDPEHLDEVEPDEFYPDSPVPPIPS